MRLKTNVAERMLETFFRRWLLCLVPLIICCTLGVLSVTLTPERYVSQGLVSASPDTLLGNLANVGDNGFGFDTPAAVTSRRINEQLRSDDFVAAVAERAGLTPSLEAGLIELSYVRARVSAAPDGVNLFKVGAMTEDPELSVRLALATIESFVQSVVDEDLSESLAAQTFYEGVAAQYQVEVDTARAALDVYLVDHPAPPFGARPAGEQLRIAELTTNLERAQSQYTGAQANVESAKLSNELAQLDIRQRLRVVDPPARPVAPITGLRSAVISLGVFVVLGVMLTVGLVALSAFLDKTVRTVDEILPRFGLDVVATLPMTDLGKAVRGR